MTKEKITIIGGGMTGLSAAYLAAKDGFEVTLLEGSSKVGGLLNTFEIGGNQLEHYYHHFFTQDAEFHWLLKELNLMDKVVYHKTTMGVFRNGKIYNFNGIVDLLKFRPANLWDKFLWGLSTLYLGKMVKWEDKEHIATLDWFYKYSGKGMTDALWKPMLDIKFGPYADKVPLSWMIGRLAQRLNSRSGGDERLAYIKGSWKVLLDKMVEELTAMGVKIKVNEPVEELIIQDNELKGIKTSKNKYSGGKYLITIPSVYFDKVKNLPQSFGGNGVQYFGAVCTILELKKKFSDIYWMNVADEGYPFGGIIEHTNMIPKEEYNGSHILYLSRYFAMSEDLAGMDAQQIKERMIPPLKRINPEFSEDWIKDVHVFKTNTAATVCDLYFSEKVPQSKTELKNLFVANMAHIYPDERSTNNSIRVAAEACGLMGVKTGHVPYGASLSGKIGFGNNPFEKVS
ncbi:NAD(P)/FAD-dependent oxidoreductase [Jiulongibacter sediminis]|uniref:FAD-dependent oxidoreductase n=1 Tax=Jiulongibacter sediminis TaxID=1605367 RepID=A0A0P7BV44_9BACT|nr:NAD(P)/FAD-dependent oxidoreductase [Jiulongibacter sediminis]KPM48573.1 FAD-dependent oxidoreductase [Jiulongibacter sediminis]TBX25111.1 FAD-dependent oxidoreductase [Jiulongibacter sediminis]